MSELTADLTDPTTGPDDLTDLTDPTDPTTDLTGPAVRTVTGGADPRGSATRLTVADPEDPEDTEDTEDTVDPADPGPSDPDPDPDGEDWDDWGEELPAAQINADLDEEDDVGDDTDDSTDDDTDGEDDTDPEDDAGPGGVLGDDRGMSTIEYALGCVAAAALGALLYLVVTSDSVEAALTGIFERALETK